VRRIWRSWPNSLRNWIWGTDWRVTRSSTTPACCIRRHGLMAQHGSQPCCPARTRAPATVFRNELAASCARTRARERVHTNGTEGIMQPGKSYCFGASNARRAASSDFAASSRHRFASALRPASAKRRACSFHWIASAFHVAHAFRDLRGRSRGPKKRARWHSNWAHIFSFSGPLGIRRMALSVRSVISINSAAAFRICSSCWESFDFRLIFAPSFSSTSDSDF
jgi:hypothetical protein